MVYGLMCTEMELTPGGWAVERTDVTGRSRSMGTCQIGRWMGLDIKMPKSLSGFLQQAGLQRRGSEHQTGS